MAHPCCGSEDRLKTGVKIIACLEMIFFGLGSSLGGLTLIFRNRSVSGSEGLLVLICIIMFLIATRLWKGVQEENVSQCKIWLIGSIIVFCITFVESLLYLVQLVTNNMAFGREKYPTTIQGSLIGIISTLLQAYFIWVVLQFIDQLRKTQTQFQTLETVTKKFNEV